MAIDFKGIFKLTLVNLHRLSAHAGALHYLCAFWLIDYWLKIKINLAKKLTLNLLKY
jgi:hypothetical protein